MEKEIGRVYISKQGDCRVYLRKVVVKALNLKTNDKLIIEIDEKGKRLIVTKLE